MTKPSPLRERGLFSSRDTLEEALEYSQSLISARIPAEYRMEALTALHVTSNTAIKLLTSAPRNLKEVQPMTAEEFKLFAKRYGRKPGEAFSPTEFSEEDTLAMLRTKLPEITMMIWIMERAKMPFAIQIGSYALLIAQLFQLTNEELAEETAQFKEDLTNRVLRG